ncbi:LacI family DNA-binding transcriptional regulator [Mucisphaera calidilacus]|uniref:HTH-type transcriptional regulator DegA n=1 Tax=Mucisphaera calidilacus TaxID=2527982 RepID=A0A518BUE1_9BACT|nr:LacI family DNA-binding transcriptional regulator [Mucisphaera calidilacus]QDU70547.1 HTH-type transcriptional regulator DegA [Mucisphaera calidilacus]
MAVTASDIARKLGISRQTVSKVLVGGKTNVRVSDRMATRIQKVADELGYRPNTAARLVSQGRRGSIDLLMSTERGSSVLPIALINSIHDKLIGLDLQLTVTRLPDSQLTDASYVPKILREHCADGILINYTHHVPVDLPPLLDKHKIPAVWINIRRENNCVYPDEVAGTRKATEHLLGLGHTKIAFHILSEHGHFSECDRRLGYELAMRDAGLMPQVVRAGARPRQECDAHPLQDDRLERVLAWLKKPDRPTAIVAYAPIDTVVIAYAAAQLGLTLGRDLSLVGVSDDGVTNPLGIAMTQLVTPQAELGANGIRMLMRQIETPALPLDPRPVEVPLTLGHSTGRHESTVRGAR